MHLLRVCPWRRQGGLTATQEGRGCPRHQQELCFPKDVSQRPFLQTCKTLSLSAGQLWGQGCFSKAVTSREHSDWMRNTVNKSENQQLNTLAVWHILPRLSLLTKTKPDSSCGIQATKSLKLIFFFFKSALRNRTLKDYPNEAGCSFDFCPCKIQLKVYWL